MLLKKIINNLNVFLAATLLVVFLVTRFVGIPTDEINPDGVNWHYRSQQFFVGLKSIPKGADQLDKTYPHYHPGVTLAWIAGTGIELYKQLNPDEAVYNHNNFFAYHFMAKAFLIIAQAVLTIFLFYLLLQLFGDVRAFLITLLFTLEPFFLGNSRLLHMDILLTLFLFAAILLSYLAVTQFKWYYIAGTGLFLGLAFLTKSISIGALLFVLFVGGGLVLYQRGLKNFAWFKSLILLFFLVVVFGLFPVLWVAPIETLTEIFKEGERVGVRKGHDQVFFGVPTNDPGVLFYFVVLLLKTSPAIVIGVFMYVVSIFLGQRAACFSDMFCRPQFRAAKLTQKFFTRTANARIAPETFSTLVGNAARCLRNIVEKTYTSPVTYMAIFYIGYFIIMTYPTKKLDRYMLPMFPLLATVAVFGYYKMHDFVKNNFDRNLYFLVLSLTIFTFLIRPLFTYYPYYFTYTSPVFGSAQNANNTVAQKPFGIAVPALKNFILEHYTQEFGNYPRLGFYDTKPMGAIYMNSRLFDIRISGAGSYDLIVLAINEQLPESLENSEDYIFEKDSSFYVNDLEYWRIYVKRER